MINKNIDKIIKEILIKVYDNGAYEIDLKSEDALYRQIMVIMMRNNFCEIKHYPHGDNITTGSKRYAFINITDKGEEYIRVD